MKSIYKLMFLVMVSAMAGALTNCSDDSDSGTPVVRYVRITDPAASDSLLVMAGQGQMIAIMGENLQNANELWFNDQKAILTTTFITSKSIITRVPSQLPLELNNKMTLKFSDGKTLLYDFTVDINKPLVSRLKCEYVATGEIATFYGDYFYEPLSVTFADGIEAEIVSVEDQILEVRVPDGVQPGPVTIVSNFGVTETDFWFRDGRNIVASFDIPLTNNVNGTWHGAELIVASDPDIPPVNDKFIRMHTNLGSWGWFELYVGESGGTIATELQNIPEEAFANPEDYNLKFELNTLESLSGAHIRMYIGGNMPGERGSTYYNWQPNINTQGDWETVTIPWNDVYVANKNFPYNPAGYGISIHFSGPNAVHANFGMDNMRVVPKTTNE